MDEISRREWRRVVVVVGLAALFGVVMRYWSEFGFSKPDALPAWLQAVGGIGAVVATLNVAAQGERRAIAERIERSERELAAQSQEKKQMIAYVVSTCFFVKQEIEGLSPIIRGAKQNRPGVVKLVSVRLQNLIDRLRILSQSQSKNAVVMILVERLAQRLIGLNLPFEVAESKGIAVSDAIWEQIASNFDTGVVDVTRIYEAIQVAVGTV